ncbi:MAG: Eco57I restriction-modification methylase domain-containing protein, partial [Thermoplasmata archaeon]
MNGIDIHPFAVSMARVNYLLAISPLIDDATRRLMTDFRIPVYWTDSLARFSRRIEPTGIATVEVEVAPLGTYRLPPPEKVDWDELLTVTKRAVEMGWSEERFLEEFEREKRLEYETSLLDLYASFRERAQQQKDSRWLPTLRNVAVVDALKGQCDFIVGNPPWVRIHNVSKQLKDRISEGYRFYAKDGTWNPHLKQVRILFGSLVDYSIAFVESGLKFLGDKGKLGFVITSNVVRSLSAGEMRKSLLAKTVGIKDYALSKLQLFEAQNAPLVLSVDQGKPEVSETEITLENRSGETASWRTPWNQIPIQPRDHKSPWLFAPPPVIRGIRLMQENGERLGDHFRVMVGIYTNANDLYFVTSARPTEDPNVVIVGTDGVRIEKSLLRPILRGRDIHEWGFESKTKIIWTHDDEGRVLPELPEAASRHFHKHETRLRARNRYTIRSAIKAGAPFWVIGDAVKAQIKHKVVWQRVEKTCKAVYIPPLLDGHKVILDNSVSFVVVPDEETGYALAALLNSSPVRAFLASFILRTGAE